VGLTTMCRAGCRGYGCWLAGGGMAEQPMVSFAGLLRQLRVTAGMTQEQLAEAARLSTGAVSDLERGINRTARRETALLPADALGLTGVRRDEFEAAARGRPPGAAEPASLPRGAVAGAGPRFSAALPGDGRGRQDADSDRVRLPAGRRL
jgi:transcriptional regulator with XRE-family HTH domain